MNKQAFTEVLLNRTNPDPGEHGDAFAPANIALCKYWGKRNAELNLPVNSSISVALKDLGTHTIVSFCDGPDQVFLNGEPAPADFSARVSAFLDLFRQERSVGFKVDTKNNIPTGAGLASSASGFAALVKALDKIYRWGFNARELSMLARLGSGSATRSLYHGFCVWHAGDRSDGMDSYAEEIETIWSDFRVGILEVCSEKKQIGSTEAMNLTSETSTLYQAWPKQAECDYDTIRTAIAAKDFALLGTTAENNALAMHATMLSSWPPICYWKPKTLSLMQKVWAAREDGLDLYFTIDAGPNIKLLFQEKNESDVKSLFSEVNIVSPFV